MARRPMNKQVHAIYTVLASAPAKPRAAARASAPAASSRFQAMPLRQASTAGPNGVRKSSHVTAAVKAAPASTCAVGPAGSPRSGGRTCKDSGRGGSSSGRPHMSGGIERNRSFRRCESRGELSTALAAALTSPVQSLQTLPLRLNPVTLGAATESSSARSQVTGLRSSGRAGSASSAPKHFEWPVVIARRRTTAPAWEALLPPLAEPTEDTDGQGVQSVRFAASAGPLMAAWSQPAPQGLGR
mmetsp:Transcript_101090/g.292355  ORF Transcript_101090/g.292355 Transcript_101090/m.292355 type:complete len:243 (+) Transcript_101090:493-1221(+)